MSDAEIRGQLDQLQRWASTYFEIIYKTIFAFWRMPDVPTGGNILTGAFAAILIWVGRMRMTQPYDPKTLGGVLLVTLFFVLLMAGLWIVVDQLLANGQSGQQRVRNMKKLVSVICVGITLGLGFVALDYIVPWILVPFGLARWWNWGTDAANYFVATAAALLAGAAIFANTISRLGVGAYAEARVVCSTIAILAIVTVAINLIISPLALDW